jgi:two-component system nitrogen regulation response regulator GlnG
MNVTARPGESVKIQSQTETSHGRALVVNDQVTVPLPVAEELASARSALRSLKDGLPQKGLQPETLGQSSNMRKVVGDILLVAPTEFTVLITGETGTGKEMVANAIHQSSRRRNGPFVPVDCACIPATLIESELFGYEKGAYTGAASSQPGKFETASGGTLFLDEISNLPLPVQPKLLRALQERKIWRVGGRTSIDVDIRVIAATNQDLAGMVQAGHFRTDLYHRLNEFRVTLPPLRDRQEDIILYAKDFLSLTRTELGKAVRGFTPEALEALMTYDWPGNVRELRNVIRRAALCCDPPEAGITADHLGIAAGAARSIEVHSRCYSARPEPGRDGKRNGNTPLREIIRQTVRQMERDIIAEVLKQTNGNKAEAARILQVDYKTLHNKVREYGITL